MNFNKTNKKFEVDEGIEFYLFMVEYQQWLTLNKLDPYDEENRNFVFATLGEWDLRHILPKQVTPLPLYIIFIIIIYY